MPRTHLPTTTQERLEAVADLVEFRPELYDQKWWDSASRLPEEVVGTATALDARCGTTACIAGWAVRLMGQEELWQLTDRNLGYISWREAGKEALGLSDAAASVLFGMNFIEDNNFDHLAVADVLRRLSKVEGRIRTLRDLQQAVRQVKEGR